MWIRYYNILNINTNSSDKYPDPPGEAAPGVQAGPAAAVHEEGVLPGRGHSHLDTDTAGDQAEHIPVQSQRNYRESESTFDMIVASGFSIFALPILVQF